MTRYFIRKRSNCPRQERVAMDAEMGDPDSLSRLELISLYINGYYTLDAAQRSRFEIEFRKRKLPLPRMPPAQRTASPAPSPRPRVSKIDRGCFLDYILLVYSGTAIFYSWAFLITRLIRWDFRENPKHRLAQSAIALAYIAAEILLFEYFSSTE